MAGDAFGVFSRLATRNMTDGSLGPDVTTISDDFVFGSVGGGGGGGGGVAIRAVATAIQSGTSPASIALPTSGVGGSVIAGDFAIIMVGLGASTAPTTPSGWTPQGTFPVNGTTSTMAIYTKTLVSGDLGTTPTITTVSIKSNTHCIILFGVDPTTPVDVAIAYAVHGSGSGGTTLATPNVTPATTGAFIVGGAMDRGSPGSPTITDVGTTVQSSMLAQTGGAAVSSILVTNGTGTAGTPVNAGTASYGTTNLQKIVFTLAIRPAASTFIPTAAAATIVNRAALIRASTR